MASGSFIQVKPLNGCMTIPGLHINRGAPKCAKRNLFGAPEKGEVSRLLMRETAEKLSEFVSRYSIENIDDHLKFNVPSESCRDSELQQEKCEIKLRATQSIVLASENKRAKPYDRQQKSMTDFFNQRKACNKGQSVDTCLGDNGSIELTSDCQGVTTAIKRTTDSIPVLSTTRVPASSSESPSVQLQTPDRENVNKPREQITLHTTLSTVVNGTKLS